MASPAGRTRSVRARDARWRGALAVLDELRRHPGVTRADVARRLTLSTGSATEITARLRELALLSETPAAATGRGRPTTVLNPHPDGPVVIAVDLRQEDWRCAVAEIDGRPRVSEEGRHASRHPARVVAAVGEAVRRVHDRLGGRVRAVAVAVAATVRHGGVVQSATLGWGAVDLGGLAPAPGLPLLVGNDATLAGAAEARYGAAVGTGTALHVTIEVGVGGTLVVDGLPIEGATGAGGEFGHLPLGDPELRCPCGALGCWDLAVDGRAIARHLGEPPPRDPRSYAQAALARAEEDPAVRSAVGRTASGFGRGIAGLINALDPGIVTLGGFAEPLRAAAPEEFAEALTDGLMRFRRADPPPVVAATLGDDGALHGAAALALDRVLTEEGLDAWAADHTG
ncbi:ROK family transcriptional regulator [Nonomuraea roseoviolacea]|uniref:NBD/HSP70 family sugar kinase n=1 Tax=Nonomuraea roseoviolacea subsp. carminata TaxID=160689 RepID=A0ABT1KBA5_9ACTN|nr:ROK family transcriptional regulator [Nonomuraea roseoviolacea]MCP2351303.1 putative NBD/HSP70 family sugar kinase [Nonomuraea roseoviolacea subsp. carminata]